MRYFFSYCAAASIFSLALVDAAAIQLSKRIAQVISDSTQPWVQACTVAGGGAACNDISVTAFSTLLAAPGPCEQQDAADKMVDLAKTLNNNAKMIQLAQIFCQQPRNSPNSQSVLYCQQPPKNVELNGLFQCQFQGVNPNVFTGGVAVGQPGTIPLGHSSPLNPAGSCAAHTQGGIADGTQLVDLTQDPGSPGTATPSTPAAPPATPPAASPSAASVPPPAATDTSTAPDNQPASSGDFHLQNGQAAQKLNKQFATLSSSSSCTDGDEACIGGAFAQCSGGAFLMTPCASGLSCFALPLVNKQGTTLTCDTRADAEARITASGATGGIDGDSSTASSADASSTSTGSNADTGSASTSTSADNQDMTASSSSADFHLQNGLDAQKLNKQFASLTESSSCQTGESACVKGAFAQCVGGQFVTTQCAAGTICAALPLVNKKGTSLTCDTQADAEARIAAAGASGGLTGA